MILQKQPVRFRHELKYTIHRADDYELTQRLRKLFAHDAHAGAQGEYRVTSLYFDTPYDTALRQKIDGVDSREKFRLRHYNGDTSFIRLEKKIKRNGLCGKYSARLTIEQVQRLLNGELAFLAQADHPLLVEFYSKLQGQLLRPQTVVCYDREAFLYAPGNVRVTLDRRLRTGLSSAEFLNPSRCYADVSDDTTVLEVKYDAFLPEPVRMAVQIPNRMVGSFSKYAVCRRYD